MKKNHNIYKITNTKNGKFYYGRTKRPKGRKYEHFHDLKMGKHCNQKLQNSFNKHGEANFRMDFQVTGLTEAEAIELEQLILDEVVGMPLCYNLSNDASGGCGERGENHPNYGRKHTDEARRNMSEAKRGEKNHRWGKEGYWKGKKRPEHAEKMREIFTGDNNPAKRPDVRQKMSEAARNRKKQTCPHCGLTGTTNMKRYHFDNCKHK